MCDTTRALLIFIIISFLKWIIFWTLCERIKFYVSRNSLCVMNGDVIILIAVKWKAIEWYMRNRLPFSFPSQILIDYRIYYIYTHEISFFFHQINRLILICLKCWVFCFFLLLISILRLFDISYSCKWISFIFFCSKYPLELFFNAFYGNKVYIASSSIRTFIHHVTMRDEVFLLLLITWSTKYIPADTVIWY